MSILISIAQQRLYLKNKNGEIIADYPISSALNGVGEKMGSFQTPRGNHIICEKIGDHLPIHTVFKSRIPTGEIFSPSLASTFPERDWILTRILWLKGCDAGVNCGGQVDTKSRYIYIHGTDDEKNIGKRNSHGCIRMKNTDVIELFDQVRVGDAVLLT